MQQNGILRVVSNDQLDKAEQQRLDRERDAAKAMDPEIRDTGLINHIRSRFEIMRNHRESSGIDRRLLRSLRAFNGEYDPDVLAAIKQFGGSEVYARLVSTKARGATALLRDIYFASERPWTLEATPDPELPDNIAEMIPQLVQMEAQAAQAQGTQLAPDALQQRVRTLMDQARLVTKDTAAKEAQKATYKLDDILTEGGFYKALGEVLVDIPLFPFSVLKGPVVKMSQDVKYVNGVPQISEQPKLFWKRVSPFDFYFLPGSNEIGNTECCERLRWSRKDLNDLIGLPGWDEEAIRTVLNDYDDGLRDWMTGVDSERAIEEDREDPTWNRSGMIDALEFHGNVKGDDLIEIGFSEEDIPDPDLDYFIEAWVVGRHVLKTQLSPSPRKRHPYFVTSFEKVPGTILGHALPDMLSDIGDVANAAMRNLVNNMSMASGPQVVIMENRLSEAEDPSQIYPWKRWMMNDDPMMGNQTTPPVAFFQPQSNANELMAIYQKMTELADEVSAIPRYITGSGAPGGAGRTASGLSMLMGNASKVLQQVAYNIDTDILHETLTALYDLLMVADGGVTLRGDENIVVRGVTKVLAKETERARQLEFLSLTANPIDLQILGVEGRAEILRSLAKELGLDAGSPVPSKDELATRQKQAVEAQQANAQAQAVGEGDSPPAPGGDTGPRSNLVQPGANIGGI